MSEEDRAWRAYARRAREELLPKLLSSNVFLSVQSGSEHADVKQATEIGMALLLGKPVILLVLPGKTLPPGLRRAADLVLDDFDPARQADQDRLADVLTRATQ